MVTPGGTPSDSDHTPSSRGGLVAAVVIGVGALAVFILASRPEPASTTTTIPAATIEETTTTSTPPTPDSTVVTGPSLRDLVPEVPGALVTAISGQTGVRLLTWPPDSEQTELDIPMITGPQLAFDVSGRRLAFLGPSATEGDALYTGRQSRWHPFATQVTSFRWHSTRPGSLVWVELGRGLCQAEVDLEGSLTTGQSCRADSSGDVVGFDEQGFLLADEGEIVRMTRSGQEVGRVSGTDAMVGPDGSVLIVDRPPDGSVVFSLAAPDLSELTALDWAPDNASGEYGFVARSPVNARQFAFLVVDSTRSSQIQLWEFDVALVGAPSVLLSSPNIGARLWDITWDSTGRYILAPGERPGNGSLVVVHDTFTNQQTFLTFDNWVQDTQLVVESRCQDAGFFSSDWPPGRLAAGVTAADYQMVVSRSAELESWYFLSARLHGGDHDGAIATWALPGYPGEGEYVLTPIPANEPALGPSGSAPWEPENYGVTNWMDIDGASISQWCVETLGG